jgi:hypothetical protein
MKIEKYDMPILGEFFNSLNSDRLYSMLTYHGWAKYVDSLDDNHCVFSKDILNTVDTEILNRKMARYQWYVAVNADTFIGYRPRFAIIKDNDIFNYSFYYFAPAAYENSILKNGLRPKAKNDMERYEPSVYLFSEYLYLLDKDNCNSVDTEILNLIDKLRYRSGNPERYSIFEIKFKNKNIELHRDPTYEYGCFVHRLILPAEIKLIKHY